MSKLNSNKISFKEKDFLIEVSESDVEQGFVSKQELIANRAQEEAEQEIKKAQKEAMEIVEKAKLEAQKQSDEILENANNQAKSIIEQAQNDADKIVEEANTKKDELLANAQSEVEHASQEAANKGYEEGYQDAQNKFIEENEERIHAFDEFCSYQNIVRDKVLKNASREILNIIENISRKVLLKEVDAQTLDNIIKNTVTLFNEKENIKIILSEKYAKLLYEIQKHELDKELDFEDFKQYEGFSIIYNKELNDDTIIVENPKERFCSSISTQLDKIIREIFEKTQNGNLDIEEYDETSTTE